MAKIDLTADRLRELLHYDSESGVFTRRIATGRWRAGDIAGCTTDRYTLIRIDGELYPAHRLAWLYVYGHWPTKYIDHIDGVKGNNSFANLREATKSENGQNIKHVGKRSSSNLLGVSWNKNAAKWIASIRHNGKSVHLGLFTNREEAGRAYIEAKRELHPFNTL